MNNIAKGILFLVIVGVISCTIGAIMRGWAGFWAVVIALIMLAVVVRSISQGHLGLLSILRWFVIFALLTLPFYLAGNNEIVLEGQTITYNGHTSVTIHPYASDTVDETPTNDDIKGFFDKHRDQCYVFASVNGKHAVKVILSNDALLGDPDLAAGTAQPVMLLRYRYGINENWFAGGAQIVLGKVKDINNDSMFNQIFEAYRDFGRSFSWWNGLFYPVVGVCLGLLLMGISKALGAK